MVAPTLLWQPPLRGLVKVNWDASIHKDMGCVGFGCVARDHIGDFLVAKVSYKRTVYSGAQDGGSNIGASCSPFCQRDGFY